MIFDTNFLIGLLVGLILMWIFDWWLYSRRRSVGSAELDGWRQKLLEAENATANLEQQLSKTESELAVSNTDLEVARANVSEAIQQREVANLAITDDLAAARAEIETLQSQLSNAQEDYEGQLRAADARIAELEEARPVDATVEMAAPETSLGTLAATVAPPVDRDIQLELDPDRKDNLKLINGIGPVYEKRLNGAGIQSFHKLGARTAEQVRDIINPKNWQFIDPQAWIDEARHFDANPDMIHDDLPKIKGIGPVYNGLLKDAGIHTFADLADSTVEVIEQIIQPDDFQNVDIASWIEAAKKRVGVR